MSKFKLFDFSVIGKAIACNVAINTVMDALSINKSTLKAAKRYANGPLMADLLKTVETWDEPPRMVVSVEEEGNNFIAIVGPDPGDPYAEKWWFLNHGTSVRHAILSNDWVSKTQPGMLQSMTGAGRVVAVRSSYMGQGIVAREWDRILTEKHSKRFSSVISNAVENGAMRTFY